MDVYRTSMPTRHLGIIAAVERGINPAMLKSISCNTRLGKDDRSTQAIATMLLASNRRVLRRPVCPSAIAGDTERRFRAQVRSSFGAIVGRPESIGRIALMTRMMQSSRRSSPPTGFDGICRTTHEYALGQRPTFGRSGRRQRTDGPYQSAQADDRRSAGDSTIYPPSPL
jgi:hypothetical protein